MKRVKDCKDVSIMSPQDEQLEDGQVYSVCMLQISCTTVLSKHKQTKSEQTKLLQITAFSVRITILNQRII